MKKVVIEVPKERAETVQSKFPDAIYSVTEAERSTRFVLYVPDEMLDDLIHQTNGSIREHTASRPFWTGIIPGYDELVKEDDRITLIEVSTPDFVISPFIDRLLERFEQKEKKLEKAPIEKIVAATKAYTQVDSEKFILAAIAGIVALTGLFLNNVGIIIGAMLLSPLLGPIYALAVYIAIGDVKTTLRCVGIIGLIIALLVILAATLSFILSLVTSLPLTTEILARMDANAVYLLMAVLLGFATMIALSEGIPEGIAGVAIAAALLPPAVVTGIAIALYPAGVLKAAVLTLQNIVGLVAGSIAGVMFLHIGPRDLFAQVQSRQVIIRVAWFLTVVIVLLVIVSFLI